MLIRNTILYSLGRGASGLVNLLALSLFTRLLNPTEYGHYALVLVWVGVVGVVAFQWLHLGARRFFSAYNTRRASFLSAIGGAYLRIAGALGLLTILLLLGWREEDSRDLIVLGAILLCAQAWLDLNLELSLAGLRPLRYGVLNLIRAVIALACGGALVYLGLGARGAIIGAIVGYLAPGVAVAFRDWRGVDRRRRDAGVMRDVFHYGWPLTGAYALAFVVTFSDRLLLGWLKEPQDVGTYAAAYDLTFQGLMALMMMVNLSAFPLAVRALEERGIDAARIQLTQHATLLLAAAVPATVGLALLAPNVALVFFGGSFQSSAAQLIPWLAFGTFVAGVKAFYFDLSFQLGRDTTKQVWISALAVAVNVGLNLWWIPAHGVLGAAWASLLAFLVGGALSVVLSRRVFPLPLPVAQWVKVGGASGVMALALLLLAPYRGLGALVAQVAWGALVYAAVAILLNVGESRTALARALRN